MGENKMNNFEKWFASQIDSEYCSPNVKALMLECWQAAVGSVSVDIKSSRKFISMRELKIAIEKAGVKLNE